MAQTICAFTATHPAGCNCGAPVFMEDDITPAEFYREAGRREILRELFALDGKQHQFEICNEMGYCCFCGNPGDEPHQPSCLWLRASQVK